MKRAGFSFFAVMAVALFVFLNFSLWAADAWKVKKYTEWTESEATQVLQRSPWANTESVVTGMSQAGSSEFGTNSGQRSSPQSAEDTNAINLTVAWYSAMPVREAHARLASMHHRASEDQLKQFLQPVTEVCLITVAGPYSQPFIDAHKEQLIKKTYLQAKGKEKIYATDYTPPSAASRLAIFRFPRTVNNVPIFTEADKDVEFVTDLGNFKVRSHFTPKKMIFGDQFTF